MLRQVHAGNPAMGENSVAIVGAGMVGVSSAIALARKGYAVTIFDRAEPGGAASTWNAGVLATSSLSPLCNPSIFAKLPLLLAGRVPGFRLNPWRLPALAGWGWQFLLASRQAQYQETVQALNALISYSRRCHHKLLGAAGAGELLSEKGWLHLFREPEDMRKAQTGIGFYERHGVGCEAVTWETLREMEPALQEAFAGALYFPGSAAVLDPRLVMNAYIRLMKSHGVNYRRAEIRGVSGGPVLHLAEGEERFSHIVIAAGPWSATLLRPFGTLPMVVERGYLQKYALEEGNRLERPVFDVTNGIVLSPRPEGVQLSTGTELTIGGSHPRKAQFRRAEEVAGRLLSLGAPVKSGAMIGDRPSLPDGKPAIGPVRAAQGLWLAAGHQHIGFSTGPATGEIIADMIEGEKPKIDPAPFSPSRFGF